MATQRLVLNFPPNLIGQPVTYQLITEYGIKVNILRARITPKERGRLVLEMSAPQKKLEAALQFVAHLGVEAVPLAQDVRWRQDRCIECSACTSACPTGALSVTRPEMRVRFDHDKCIACELCVPTCAYGAMEILF